jgi:hypothetical protein
MGPFQASVYLVVSEHGMWMHRMDRSGHVHVVMSVWMDDNTHLSCEYIHVCVEINFLLKHATCIEATVTGLVLTWIRPLVLNKVTPPHRHYGPTHGMCTP